MSKKETECSESVQQVKDHFKRQREDYQREEKTKQRKSFFIGMSGLFYYSIYICGAVAIFGASYITGIVVFLGIAIPYFILSNNEEP
jgi:hypothetical protein